MLPKRLLNVARRATAARLPRGWRDAVLQVSLWGVADLLYEGVRGLVAGRADAALSNARAIVSIERATGTFVEPALQSMLIGEHGLIVAANWIYINAQFTVNAVFLAFLYAYRNEIFYFVRNMFFVSMGIALAIHLAIPVAPPRMLTQLGFVDTIHDVARINQDSGAVSMFVNPFAAVPSMHMCFALLVGLTALRLLRSPWLRAIALGYPVIVLAVIVVTANHFLFDALAGALTAAIAALAAREMGRIRPTAWSWNVVLPAPASAAAVAAASASAPPAPR